MTKPNKLLLAIDTQYDFVMSDGRLPVPGAEAIVVPGIQFLASLSPDEYAGAVFTFDTHSEAKFIGSPENVGDEAAGVPGFPLHCEKGTPGWENVFNPEILPKAVYIWNLEKGVFDMWEEPSDQVALRELVRLPGEASFHASNTTAREQFFEELHARGVDTVTVIGVAADFCVMWAIRGLLERGFNVEVVEQLTAGIHRDIAQTIADEFPDQVTLI